MEPNYGVPLGAPMPADQRRGFREWQPVGGLGIAASVLIGLVALVDVLQTVADARGLHAQLLMFVAVYYIALLAAAVVFIVWLWRARSNAELAAGPQSQRLGKGWGIGSWICPVVNLWYPYQYVVDVWRGSGPNREGSDGLVLAWWLTYLASNIVARFGGIDDDHSVAIVSCVLDVAAAVAVVLVIRKISERQSVARA